MFLVFGIVILFVVTCFDLYFIFQIQHKITAGYLSRVAQGASNTVKKFTREKFNILETTADHGKLIMLSREAQKKFLGGRRETLPDFRQFVLLDQQEQELSGQIIDYDKHELFYQLSKKKRYISPVNIDSKTGTPKVVMAVPVIDSIGGRKGILAAEVDMTFIWRLIGNLKVGENGMAYVVDRRGSLIAFSDIARVLRGENLIGLGEVNRFIRRENPPAEVQVSISKGIRNSYAVTTHIPLDAPDWAIVVELPVMEAYRSLTRHIFLSILIILFMFILVSIISLYLSKRITRPIRKLRDATRKISDGGLDTKIKIDSKDEIGELADTFNLMTDKLSGVLVSKQYSDQLLDQLKRSESELRRFVHIGSHHLQEPLRNIASFLQLLDVHQKNNTDPQTRECIDYAVDGAIWMKHLINDLVSYADLDIRKPALLDIDCRSVLETALTPLRPKMKRLKAEVTHDELPVIQADRKEFVRLFQDLLGNSLKFCGPEPPRIHIGVKQEDTRKGPVKNGKYWTFSFRDNGIGIKKEYHERIFNIFEKLHSRWKYWGTGTGLALCKKIVERHKGIIWVESEEGKGATFSFTLPARAPA